MTTDWQSYRFRPVYARADPEATRLFMLRLRRALRAAHGLGVVIRVSCRSGVDGDVAVEVPKGVGTRWMQFGLAEAYELGQWQSGEREARPAGILPRFVVSAGGSSELPFHSSPDAPPWSENVFAELSTARRGVELEWELTPDLTLPIARPRPIAQIRFPMVESRIRTLPERVLEDSSEARRTGLRWRLRGRILAASDPEHVDSARRVAHLIEIVSHVDGGNGLRCQSVRSALAGLRNGVVLTEAEVSAVFPPSASSALRFRSESAAAGPRLWLGPDLRGAMVGLPLEPSQGRHLLVLGETGMGKSSLIVQLAWQALRWGNVVFFDPIGDTAREFLAGLPELCVPTVAWMSASAPGLTLNLLAEVAGNSTEDGAGRDRMVNDVVAALRRVRAGRYVESSFWGPRLEEMLSLALHAASRWPGASLSVAERLLSPAYFPIRTVPESARGAVTELRRRIEASPQDGEGARRLLSEIGRSSVLRDMIDAEEPTWSVAGALDPGRTTVVSGDAPEVGESTARYLLAVVLALVWNAALARRQPAKTFLILDEAQWYAHEGVGEMLRLGRRFNLHVWAATQSLRSLPETLRDAFSTNSADLVLFRGAPEELRDFARWVPDLTPERIMRLPRGEAAVLVGKGSATHWIHLAPPQKGRTDPARFAPPHRVATRGRGAPPPLSPLPSPAATDCISRAESASFAVGYVEQALARMLENGDTNGEFTVHLSDLRASINADSAEADRAVRAGGRMLAADGALLRSGRDNSGAFWVLSRDRLAELIGARRDEPATRNSDGDSVVAP